MDLDLDKITPKNVPWNDLWDKGFIPWHMEEPNPQLVQYYDDFIGKQEDPEKIRICLPLCGKSIDLKWLYDKGFTVIGIELVEKGILEFFKDSKLEYEKKEVLGAPVYMTKDKRLTLIQEDIYKVTPELVGGPVDFVLDRGSMVALPEDKDKDYITLMKALCPNGQQLLNVFEYDKSKYPGPPRCISVEEVKELYGPGYEIKLLGKDPDSQPPPGPLEEIFVLSILISKKA